VIELRNILKSYPMGKRELKVLQGINLNIDRERWWPSWGPPAPVKARPEPYRFVRQAHSGSYLLEGKEVGRLGGRTYQG